MNIVTYHYKKILIFFSLIIFLFSLTQCGLYRKTDARKVSGNAKERVKKNLEEGKRIKFGDLANRGTGAFEFASSNEMWRASIEILDFIPLSSADYGGGIIITDWYNDNEKENSVKIMVRFLSNEVRADGLKVTVFSKDCKPSNDCSTSQDDDLSNDIKLAILQKASIYKNEIIEKERQELEKRGTLNTQVVEDRD